MDIDEDFKLVLEKWGTEEHLYNFLYQEMENLGPIIYGENFGLPNIQIKPTWLAKGIMMEHPTAGGDYQPPEKGDKAEIGLFPSILTDDRMVRIVLAHELIHHWEHLATQNQESYEYPAEVNKIIENTFKTAERIRRWRNGHSDRFISKAVIVANHLGFPIQYMLFRG